MFVVIDGMDGSGKSLMIAKLAGYLINHGNQVWVTAEPTMGKFGKQAREFLKNDKDPHGNAKQLLELFVQDRSEHLIEIIKHLNNGEIVICDRYYYSTMVYQNAQGLGWNEVIDANMEFLNPDVALIMDLDVDLTLNRVKKRGSKIEKFEEKDFLRKIRRNFKILKSKLSDNIVYIDAGKSKEVVFENIKKVIDQII